MLITLAATSIGVSRIGGSFTPGPESVWYPIPLLQKTFSFVRHPPLPAAACMACAAISRRRRRSERIAFGDRELKTPPRDGGLGCEPLKAVSRVRLASVGTN